MRCNRRAAHCAAGRGYPGNQSALHGPSRLPDQETCDLTADAASRAGCSMSGVILHTSGLLDVAARRSLRAIRLAPENGAKNFGVPDFESGLHSERAEKDAGAKLLSFLQFDSESDQCSSG